MTERDLERRAQRRLAVLRHVEEVSFNVAATCRYYGISRQCYYGWLRRYEADGLDGLKDRSQRPHHSPRATQMEVVEKIIWLWKHYHFGPAKIAMYLARYHDVTISVSGVWRILKRLGDEPAAHLPALPTAGAAVETLREATTRPAAAGRRQIHRTTRANRPPEEVLPIHRHR
jgi:transposase